jgi:Holliday junction resolvase-like predicted endonuclease
LKLNNIQLSAAEIGVKYEDVTKRLLSDLGFNIDEELRAKINTNKDKIDILINLGNNEVIIVECKTSKSTQYNKFSACSRQMKAYHENATHNGFRVIKSLLIAPDFTQDFIDECEIEINLNLSLISSEVLYNICNGFKNAQHKIFPVNLLMRDAVISDEKILKALKVK